jgi:hypothetical protein
MSSLSYQRLNQEDWDPEILDEGIKTDELENVETTDFCESYKTVEFAVSSLQKLIYILALT